MSNADVDWDLVSYVTSSQYRMETVAELSNGPATPSAVGANIETSGSTGHASRAISELEEKGLVELLVSEDRKKGRYYGLTDTGEDVAEQVAEVSR